MKHNVTKPKYGFYTIMARYAAVFALMCLLTSCFGDEKLIETSYRVADELILQMAPPDANDSPIMAASFVNIDNLDKSSTMGRVISEYIASRFVKRGYKVVELKVRDSVYVKEQSGEFLLSRDLNYLSQEHETSSLIVGTYSVASNTVYLSAKVVDPATSMVVATCDFAIPVNANVIKMLGKL